VLPDNRCAAAVCQNDVRDLHVPTLETLACQVVEVATVYSLRPLAACGIDLPSTKSLDGPLVTRHDIVHRSGRDKAARLAAKQVDPRTARLEPVFKRRLTLRGRSYSAVARPKNSRMHFTMTMSLHLGKD
jgi:hypothetical protein